MWNHLVSQETWQNDEEDKCNVRSAKRGERRGEGEANIENNVLACNLKSSAQKVSQHRLRDFNFEAQIVQNSSQRVPRSPFGRTLDSPWELLGLCWEIWGLLGRSLEHLGSSVELLGSSLGALGSDFRALGNDFGRIWG